MTTGVSKITCHMIALAADRTNHRTAIGDLTSELYELADAHKKCVQDVRQMMAGLARYNVREEENEV